MVYNGINIPLCTHNNFPGTIYVLNLHYNRATRMRGSLLDEALVLTQYILYSVYQEMFLLLIRYALNIDISDLNVENTVPCPVFRTRI